MRCGACGATYRKGAVALVLDQAGARSARVCQGCERRGLLVVARVVTPAPIRMRDDAAELATVLRHLRTLARQAEGVRQSLEDAARAGDAAGGAYKEIAHHGGRAEGIESAIQAIDRMVRGKA